MKHKLSVALVGALFALSAACSQPAGNSSSNQANSNSNKSDPSNKPASSTSPEGNVSTTAKKYNSASEWRADLKTKSDELVKAAAAANVKADPDKAGKLASRVYQGPFKLFWGSGQYLGHEFVSRQAPAAGQPDQTVWAARHGSYSGLNAYWNYHPVQNRAWQAQETCGDLVYWNQDGAATGPPEDWELFVFEAVDAARAIMRVKNVYGCYVRFDGGKFRSNGNAANADLFIVE